MLKKKRLINKNKIFFLLNILLVLINFKIESDDMKIQNEILNINTEILESTLWLSEDEWWELEFKKNKFFSKQTFGDGGEFCNGTFILNQKLLSFLPDDCDDQSNRFPIRKMQCKLISDKTDFRYSQKLLCDNRTIFWKYNSILPEGTTRIVNKNEAYILRDRFLIQSQI
ncbi:hypothetical protein LEP1GSC199_0001 [Leptospira vanthielii serovar Holland str. Waz Holland = ATCC 700522]|uniref:Uncharacterized protein n=1 Tax=Leptospira vanthielii serovar Holland str. Waz Holland = ATCC 700522 TaxID=1218591 RepID=N1VZD5_9LEPT|nr:hypothetical protein LEP1GSC199_0001 [Leptospira vanthielii serovar Holland str. Waz Holland = ATCC 700522]